MKKTILLAASSLILLASCAENEDVVKDPSKEGSITATIGTKHINNADVLTIKYSIYSNGKLDKSGVIVDTLKSLGTTTQEGEDNEGNTQMISVPKDYEIYLTVE